MKVLMQIRADYQARPGGDATQAEQTAAELRLLGVDVDLVGGVAPDLAGYDLVHIFNTQVIGEPVRQAIRARSWGLPVVLSPIYWNPTGFRAATHLDTDQRTEETANDRAERALQQLTLGAAALLLPNSKAETAQISTTFPGVTGQVRVIPNAVDPLFATGDSARFCAEHRRGTQRGVEEPTRPDPRLSRTRLAARPGRARERRSGGIYRRVSRARRGQP